jgi:hypothetical protein
MRDPSSILKAIAMRLKKRKMKDPFSITNPKDSKATRIFAISEKAVPKVLNDGIPDAFLAQLNTFPNFSTGVADGVGGHSKVINYPARWCQRR